MNTLICGAGGFIGGHLTRHFIQPDTLVRAVDKKPLPEWYQVSRAAENLCLDLTDPENCRRACEGVDEVYQLAADMGGMGFIENFRVDCMRNVLINAHMLEAAYQAGVKRYFFPSSACVYNTALQQPVPVPFGSASIDIEDEALRKPALQRTGYALKESDAYPAMAERGYGWEKLYAEMLCQEYHAERGLETHIARFHNVYGPHVDWDTVRAKAPAAICRKLIEAKHTGSGVIDIWGDGSQARSYMWIGDCLSGINKIMHCDHLIATPINLGSSEMVTVNQLVDTVEDIAGVKLERRYQLDAPKGVAGRNSDNTMIQRVLDWQPSTPLRVGMEETYKWIEQQYLAAKARESLLNRLALTCYG